MAQSELHAIESQSLQPPSSLHAHHGERLLRRIAAWILLVCLLQGELGAVWDREWHFYVGRDWFWTPPHTLIYSCVAGAGLLALAIVLTDTVRYYRKRPGVDSTSTVSVFTIFHAPLGYILAGVGALETLIAAPLDNFWHEMYGIDIALWAPFHMMGVMGGSIGMLGMIYIFASEVTYERTSGLPYRRFLGFSLLEWGTLFIIAGLINFILIGFLQFPIATIGLLLVPTYALPIAFCSAFLLTGALRLTHRPGTATLTVLILMGHTFLEELFVPWAIRAGVTWEGLTYRVPYAPTFNSADAIFPLTFLVSALLLDGMALWRLRHGRKLNGTIRGNWLLGILITFPQLAIAPCILMRSWNLPQVFLEQPAVIIPLDMKLQAALILVPAILICGIIGVYGGESFGDIWRLNKR